MGLGGISIWQILIILVLAVLLFGGKRMRNFGKDLGHSMKGFLQALRHDDSEKAPVKTDPKDTLNE